MFLLKKGNEFGALPPISAQEMQCVHRFPKNQPPIQVVQLDIANNEMFLKFDGKNSKSKRNPSKTLREPRKTEIKVVFSDPVHLAEIRVPKAGLIQFIGKPSSILDLPYSSLVPTEIDLVCYYERKSKRKVINAIFLHNSSSALNANVALDRYDHFYACDANTWNFSERGKVSICVAFRGWLTDPYNDQREVKFSKECVINIEGDPGGNPELYAARELIIGIQERGTILPVKPIGIIMDSELGLLKEINARRAPLIEDFYLPVGFEIMYASDATGTAEFLANMLIRTCDKTSTELLLAYEKDNQLTRVIAAEECSAK